MKINGTEYTMPELNFNTMCKLEDMGVSLTEMDQKVLTTVRGFLALAMDDDLEKAVWKLNSIWLPAAVWTLSWKASIRR